MSRLSITTWKAWNTTSARQPCAPLRRLPAASNASQHCWRKCENKAMRIKQFQYGGWENNLQLANEHVEIIISLDVGPRILSYKTRNGENVLKNYPEQMGTAGEAKWMIRGGHRFWIAPEDELLSYVP